MADSILLNITDDLLCTENIINNTQIETENKKRSVGKLYKYCNAFDDLSKAHELIVHLDGYLGNQWKEGRKVSSMNGVTHWYRCAVTGCNMMVQLEINALTDVCSIFISESEHEHEHISESEHEHNIFVK
jgi:hypothetical protein